MVKTPIIFLVFNRPDCTQKVFNAIRQARPQRLLVVADGPRPSRENDAPRCQEVRRLITEGVDWPCSLETNFSEQNLGCRLRVSSGLNWAFDRVEQAIVLEDDCLPDQSFFPFCEELLDRYRDHPRVKHINGSNPMVELDPGPDSYLFTKYALPWGWASWSKAWKSYDVDCRSFEAFRVGGGMREVCPYPLECRHWSKIFGERQYVTVGSWAWPMIYWLWAQRGLSIIPRHNLISNIGAGADATRTVSGSVYLDMQTTPIPFPLQHPSEIRENVSFDKILFLEYQGGKTGFLRNRLRRALSAFWTKFQIALALRTRLRRLLGKA